MKKLFSILAAVAAFSVTACDVHAATADNSVKAVFNGASVSVSFDNARYIDLTPGNQSMTDFNGNVYYLSISSTDAQALLNSATFQAKFTAVAAGSSRYVGMAPANIAYCQSGKTVMGWLVGATESISDNCAQFNAIYAASK